MDKYNWNRLNHLQLGRYAEYFAKMEFTLWSEPNALLVSHEYPGKKSKPEWGLNLSQKNLPLLAKFSFDMAVQDLLRP